MALSLSSLFPIMESYVAFIDLATHLLHSISILAGERREIVAMEL